MNFAGAAGRGAAWTMAGALTTFLIAFYAAGLHIANAAFIAALSVVPWSGVSLLSAIKRGVHFIVCQVLIRQLGGGTSTAGNTSEHSNLVSTDNLRRPVRFRANSLHCIQRVEIQRQPTPSDAPEFNQRGVLLGWPAISWTNVGTP